MVYSSIAYVRCKHRRVLSPDHHPPTTGWTGASGGPRLALLYLGLYLATHEPLGLPQTHPLLAMYMSKVRSLAGHLRDSEPDLPIFRRIYPTQNVNRKHIQKTRA